MDAPWGGCSTAFYPPGRHYTAQRAFCGRTNGTVSTEGICEHATKMSCSNGVVPLELPLNNVTVSSDGRVVGRGVEFGLGTPQQIVSLQVGLNERDLFVGNAAGCNDTEGKCMARFAGIYDSSESDTYDRVTQSQWNGTSEDELFAASGASFIFFNEHVQYGSNGSADAFPVYMAEVDTNSSMLHSLDSAAICMANAACSTTGRSATGVKLYLSFIRVR